MTGFNSKRQMVSESVHWSDCAVHNGPAYPAGECDCGATEPWNEDEWRRNNWRCGHGWLRGEQCEICNAAQPEQDVDYWIREATAARQAEMAMRRELEAQPQRQWIWLSDADIAEVVDTTCQYTGSYEEYLIKKAERKIRSMNNG